MVISSSDLCAKRHFDWDSKYKVKIKLCRTKNIIFCRPNRYRGGNPTECQHSHLKFRIEEIEVDPFCLDVFFSLWSTQIFEIFTFSISICKPHTFLNQGKMAILLFYLHFKKVLYYLHIMIYLFPCLLLSVPRRLHTLYWRQDIGTDNRK